MTQPMSKEQNVIAKALDLAKTSVKSRSAPWSHTVQAEDEKTIDLALSALRQGEGVTMEQYRESVESRLYNVAAAKALVPLLAPGYRLIYRSAFRWLDADGRVLSNHYDGMSAAKLAEDFGYDIAADLEFAAIIREPASAHPPAQAAMTLCEGCPPVGYPTDITRCTPCPRRSAQAATQGEGEVGACMCCGAPCIIGSQTVYPFPGEEGEPEDVEIFTYRAPQPERPQGGVVDAAEVFRIAGGDIECCPNPTAAEALACLRDLRECCDEALAALPQPQPARGEAVAWVRNSGDPNDDAFVISAKVKRLWLASNPKRVARYTRPLYTTHVPCWALPAVESALSMLDLQGYWHSDLAAFRDWLKEKSQ